MTTTPPADPAVRTRLPYLDRVRTVLVAAVILGHALMSYTDDAGSWPYQDHRETTLPAIVTAVLAVPAALGSLFAMGLLFLIAGAFTPASMAAHGRYRFLTGRALRLGVPLAAYTFGVWPALIWLLERSDGGSRTFREILTHQRPPYDNGPLWFVAVLLIFSVAAATLIGRGQPPPAPPGPMRRRHLVAVAVLTAVGSFVVRLAFPVDSAQPANLHLWQWPQCAALFCFGIAAGRRRWLAEPIPRHLANAGLVAAGTAAAALTAVIAVAAPTGGIDPFLGGTHWQSAALSAAEGVIATGASIGVLALFQRHTADRPRTALAAADRAAYHAYLLHAPILILTAIVLHHVPAPATAKLALLASLGLAVSYAAAIRTSR
ncbi:acyltransferase family protein [Dactylosporangium matsuzakiense]|uniref:Acyltransferase 3 domain-containing protein n=1 Tax=Dactylosporangium matsuzakiense TaxID=53360 RepID=A0A9W6KKI9_9ACTN|nr:acyltransferase [Dactylosporangium matsuzakiense]GLL02224.1 hypothetical protein GCM10017581_039660 [Dactylosporangium matsuzakiense]